MLLCALVSMASCVHTHTATGCEECEATLHRERVAWQLERARLASELKALRETLDSESAERLTAGMRTANAHKRDHPADRHGTSNTGNASALVLPLRTLLQTEVAEPKCSMGDVTAVLLSADPAAAVTAMFVTNVGCAMCLVPCGSAANTTSCALACIKPNEAVCTEEDRAAILAVGMPSSLADRAQLVRMLEVAARPCVACILETIACVCGSDCVPERLHMVSHFAYIPRMCLPELAARLSAGEASAFARAVAANEPFGLTVAVPTGSSSAITDLTSDLFVPTAGPLP
jgi:hypothetical protein